jgi:hypothetical protein
MSSNPNPIVMWGTCGKCGQPVALFKTDEAGYLAGVHRGLVHFTCPVSPPPAPGVPRDGQPGAIERGEVPAGL